MILLALLAILLTGGYFVMVFMPGATHQGPLPLLSREERALAATLEGHVHTLAGTIGQRNLYLPRSLERSVEHIESTFRAAGYAPERQGYEVAGETCYNIEVALSGKTRLDEIIVVGAHYDTVPGSPGANDNGSGVAAVLALAERLAEHVPSRTLRFIAFVNEEPPFFQSGDMGSVRYAKRCRERDENIVAMLSLETIGHYSDEPGSQQYPFPFRLFYPATGDFIGFIGNVSSRRLVRKSVGLFRRHTRFPSEGAAVPATVPGVGWSDHWSFWQEGYPALMVTDTAPYRYPHYHLTSDTPDQLDYDRMARVVTGLEKVITGLANPAPRR